ncbi:alpha/beta fold hydrolase [Psychrobacter sp. F1192]|uniref:Alpha/beta fold hydrolase n=1 Tax=Psychrobacter coccoides TaxID=2818440 RepID=A0ABS3NPI6_9GAMM|nr:alpha/beta fold hydrolase [Psychrobacter coccoides]MBO1531311.1 alpha/beta fold hydrolase [Psychrobacter coccoides]
MIQSLKFVSTKDGEQVAIWKVESATNDSTTMKRQNILLTHGTFSDKKVCLGIANYLAKLGHVCYIMEWRGHGDSPKPTAKFNFETIATYDFAATFQYLFDDLELDNLHCVTHSGGGICLTMFLIQNPCYIDKINSIILFACQAYGAALDPSSYAKVFAIKTFNRLLGFIPAKLLKLGTVNESYDTMAQWFDWNLHKNFNSSFVKAIDITDSGTGDIDNIHTNKTPKDTSNDKCLDYRQYMAMITTPIYAISGSGDHLIAPSHGCQLFFDEFNHSANIFYEFSKSNGHLEDYNHSRIMASRNAAKEVWPTVATWIDKHTI